MHLPAGQLFVRAYLKRLAERLSAQPGAQVTDMPVQRADRQYSSNGRGAVLDVQLQVRGCARQAHTAMSAISRCEGCYNRAASGS